MVLQSQTWRDIALEQRPQEGIKLGVRGWRYIHVSLQTLTKCLLVIAEQLTLQK